MNRTVVSNIQKSSPEFGLELSYWKYHSLLSDKYSKVKQLSKILKIAEWGLEIIIFKHCNKSYADNFKKLNQISNMEIF